MTKQVINLAQVSSQSLRVNLGGQNVQLLVEEKRNFGVFMDIYLEGDPVILGMLCRNRVPIVQLAYLGFQGDLTFYDMMGDDDPTFRGFNSRFFLVWNSEAILS